MTAALGGGRLKSLPHQGTETGL